MNGIIANHLRSNELWHFGFHSTDKLTIKVRLFADSCQCRFTEPDSLYTMWILRQYQERQNMHFLQHILLPLPLLPVGCTQKNCKERWSKRDPDQMPKPNVSSFLPVLLTMSPCGKPKQSKHIPLLFTLIFLCVWLWGAYWICSQASGIVKLYLGSEVFWAKWLSKSLQNIVLEPWISLGTLSIL